MTSRFGDRLVQKMRRGAWHLSYLEVPRLMSAFRQRWQIFCNPNATIRFGAHVKAGPGFRVHAPWGGTLIVGDDVELRRNMLFELGGPDARVTVGNGCYFTYDVIIACDTTITIGERVGLAQNTFIADGSHRYRDLSKPFLEQGYDYRPITIGDDAQVHSKVTIVNNIGERAIIGANAVITKPIPPYTVAGGVPARVIEYYGPPGLEPEGWEPKENALNVESPAGASD
jgi:acetyltransferase-like isoleucine patch superfamily enzyme